MKTKHIITICILVILFSACEKTPSIRPPFTGVELPTYKSSFFAENGDTLRLSNGSEIHVPGNAFIDTEGNLIAGKVNLVYKEIQDVPTQLVSGIPMKFGSPENPQIMESAVMFELQAYQNKNKLELAPDKSIATVVSSNEESEEYDFFSFDPLTGDWKNEGHTNPIPNPSIVKLSQNIADNKREITQMELQDCFILNYFEELDVVFDKDLNKLNDTTFNYYTWGTAPSFRTFKGVMKAKIESYGGFFMDTRCYQEVYVNGQYYSPNLVLWEPSKPLPEWLKRTDLYYSTDLKSAGNGQYYLTFYKLNRESWKTTKLYTAKSKIKMPLAKLYQQAPLKRSATLDSLMLLIDQEKEIMQAQNKVLRLFNIQKMGVYNYDIIKDEERLLVEANVSVDSQGTASSAQSDLFVIIKGENTVIRYSSSNLDHFAIFPDMEFLAFRVTANNEIALQQMKKLSSRDWSALKDGAAFQIELNATDYKISSVEDVADFLSQESQDQLLSLVN